MKNFTNRPNTTQGEAEPGSSQRHAWQSVLSLGERLLAIARQGLADGCSVRAILSDQVDLVQSCAEEIVEGQASVWISEQALARYAGQGHQRIAAQAPVSALMRACLESGKLCLSSRQGDVEQSETRLYTDRAPEALAAPLNLIEKSSASTTAGENVSVLGVLAFRRSGGPGLSEEDIALIEAISKQSALALQASLQLANEQWRLEQLALVRQVSLQITDVRDLGELARRITRLILEAFNYYYVAIFTLADGSNTLRFSAAAGPIRQGAPDKPENDPSSLQPLEVQKGRGIIGTVAERGRELLARDVQQDGLYLAVDLLPETRSEAALPLQIESRILGVLDVQSNLADDFDETDMLVLRSLADNIAAAIEGAQLYEALNRRALQLSTVYEVGSAITSILQPEKLLEEVVNLIHNRFGYPYVHLFSVHPGRRKIFYEAGTADNSQELRAEGFAYDLDDPTGLIPWVARRGEVMLVDDIHHEPLYRPGPACGFEVLSELTTPLLFGGQVLGILDIQSDQRSAFTKDDRFLFETLADNIAIAMRNASLYRTELWRRQAADSLHEVAGLLSTDVDLDQVLRAILLELERTLPLDLAAIWLLDEELEDSLDTLPVLRLAAVRGSGATHLELELGSTPDGVLESNRSVIQELPLEKADAWLLEALNAAEPVIRQPGMLYEPLGAALDYPTDYSLIAAPLRAGDQRLGVLSLAHRSSGRYGSEARAMTASFASYAAVAIENARLFEAAHEQAWVSTVLLQVADATQAITDLEQLLTTVIHMTPMLTGVRASLLYLLDEDSRFTPATASGLDAGQEAEFIRWHFEPGDSPSLDQLMTHKTPVILGMDEADAVLRSIVRGAAGMSTEKAIQDGFLVLTPLLAHGEVLGAFLIDYSTLQPGTSPALALEKFFDERLPIIQGISHQTAMAVENIRLLRAQKEEAYVSVALLQVAQAVVSANDLDEALGAIVRITPILAGVQRSLIYIWDRNNAVFRLAQAYGLSRSAESKSYRMAEFPLLEAIWLEDSLLAYPLQKEDPEMGEPPEIWSYLIPPDPEEVDHYLAEHNRLLLGFPLSVKGDVLGILLVEEPESGQGDGRSSPNRRLRSKRMEIITGISQQAALAIQNDHLQREMVERERLEREMQLAREIQQAFLPQTLPEFPGWELQVCWRTAREVGGDFYDVFELPDNRFGLVIADVADKGMPAALYMTLVRTLVRASVQAAKTAGEALEQVNRILAPEAPRGMFVTLAYAVLSIDSGELQLANAGHNPPLILHSSQDVLEEIEKSGMALGVIEDGVIEDRSLRLEEGDFLILYTDGITEAFSSDGDFYGEERLFKTILESWKNGEGGNTNQISALGMLETIDASVTQFLGDLPLSDDLTLVVLKRAAKPLQYGF